MATIYHDSDADLSALSGQTVAVVGYGNHRPNQKKSLTLSHVASNLLVGTRTILARIPGYQCFFAAETSGWTH